MSGNTPYSKKSSCETEIIYLLKKKKTRKDRWLKITQKHTHSQTSHAPIKIYKNLHKKIYEKITIYQKHLYTATK